MRGRKSLIRREQAWIVVATVGAICCGCTTRVSTKKNISAAFRPVALEATREELLEKYNAAAHGVKSINATVELKPTTGSNYSGVIEEYHEVKAFLLAARPAEIRMIGQAPVIGKTIFDMVSDGQMFRVAIPSKNKFLVGPVAVERASSKPIENLRPQHLLDALLWPEVRKEEAVLFEEFNDESRRFYVLTVLRGGYQTEILRKLWFDRADLQVARTQSYGPRGVLVSDSHFSDWQPVVGDQEQVAATLSGVTSFPRDIRIERPHDDYRLELAFTKLLLNQEIPADRFKLEQPPGTELVNVGEGPEDKPAQKEPKP
jgi:outer membrane lipoprotein-sorting protein